MRKVNQFLYLWAVLVMITACADPYVPKTVDKYVNQRNCTELEEEREGLRKNIRTYQDDGWLHPSYVLILPAVVSKSRYADAIEGSRKRIEYIESVMELKGCYVPEERREAYMQRYVRSRYEQMVSQRRRDTALAPQAIPEKRNVYQLENDIAPNKAFPVLLYEVE